MLDILILQKNIQKEFQKLIKNLLSILLIKKKLQKKKRVISDLAYDGIEFPVQEKDFSKIEEKNNIYINVFGYENELIFPICLSDEKFENSMD